MPIKFKQFQLEDLARAAMHDGAIISWEPGLGKTAAAMAWPLVKEARRVLLVVPGGLHSQFKESARQFFGIHVTTLSTVEQIRGFRLDKPHPANAAPRFFITSYQDLGQNGADERPPEVGPDGKIIETRLRQQRLLDVGLCLTEKVLSRFTGTPFEPKRYFDGIGSEQHGIRCVWKPSLSRVLAQLETFDCVVVDEGTRLQANESMVALGVRLLNPKYRLLLTGTPIKNRLESFFWLAWWVCGGSERPTARFPYAGSTEAREDFANQHLEHDRFLTREEEAQSYQYMMGNAKPKRSKIEKRSNRVCNLHRLWKIISPIVLRRRKDECGEELVPKTVRPIYIQPGEAQQMVYEHHLQHPPVAARGTPGKPVARRVQIGMQLNILRQVALCPHAPELAEVVNNELGHKVSWTDFNPKQAACLSLAADVLEQGEQIIIGSPFRAFNTALHMRLMEAGVSAVLLDGSTSQDRRGELAAQFKAGVFSAMVAGVDAMGEGHSFECCSHLVQASGSWAFDTNEQFIHRVWRLNSKKPVTIYRLVMRNTIDERVALSFEEKGGTSQLALDGRLGVDTVDEIDPEMLLAQAVKDFRRDAPTVPETDIEHQWCNVLRGRLQSAEAHYRTRRQATAALTVLPAAAPSAITLALRKARQEREGVAPAWKKAVANLRRLQA